MTASDFIVDEIRRLKPGGYVDIATRLIDEAFCPKSAMEEFMYSLIDMGDPITRLRYKLIRKTGEFNWHFQWLEDCLRVTKPSE